MIKLWMHDSWDSPRKKLPFRFSHNGKSYTNENVEKNAERLGFYQIDLPPPHDQSTHRMFWNKSTKRWNKKRLKQSDFANEWKQIRALRDKLLEESDYTQISSGNGVGVYGVPGNQVNETTRDNFKEYRDLLRTIPQRFIHPNDVIWPQPPVIETPS